jgi:hypothetical protein
MGSTFQAFLHWDTNPKKRKTFLELQDKKLPIAICTNLHIRQNFFLILVCEAIGTAATPGPIVPASGDSEDDCGEADGM